MTILNPAFNEWESIYTGNDSIVSFYKHSEVDVVFAVSPTKPNQSNGGVLLEGRKSANTISVPTGSNLWVKCLSPNETIEIFTISGSTSSTSSNVSVNGQITLIDTNWLNRSNNSRSGWNDDGGSDATPTIGLCSIAVIPAGASISLAQFSLYSSIGLSDLELSVYFIDRSTDARQDASFSSSLIVGNNNIDVSLSAINTTNAQNLYIAFRATTTPASALNGLFGCTIN
jgi:hypothetical protein